MDRILTRQKTPGILSQTTANLVPSVTVKLSAIQENYQFFKSHCGPTVNCSAVVKNNAYGLGLSRIVPALYETGCRIFWVAYLQEALDIRAVLSDPDVLIMVLQNFSDSNESVFFENHLIPVLNTPEQFQIWSVQAARRGVNTVCKPILHLETGLNRLGFREIDCAQNPEIFETDWAYIMSHLACADQPGHFMNHSQLAVFKKFKQKFKKSVQASLVASDGFFLGPDYQFDLVRIGAGLYGVNPSPYRETQMKPVVMFDASVLQIADLESGAYVGYGATFRAHHVQKIAMIGIGYGDGLPCHVKNTGRVWFQNYEARILGRISMDVIICDVSHVPTEFLYPGYRVSVLNQNYTIDDLAHDSSTIGYEILTRLRPRGGIQYRI